MCGPTANKTRSKLRSFVYLLLIFHTCYSLLVAGGSNSTLIHRKKVSNGFTQDSTSFTLEPSCLWMSNGFFFWFLCLTFMENLFGGQTTKVEILHLFNRFNHHSFSVVATLRDTFGNKSFIDYTGCAKKTWHIWKFNKNQTCLRKLEMFTFLKSV